MVSSFLIVSLVARDTLSGNEATFFSSAATYRPRKTATSNSLIKSKRPPACQMMYLTEEMCLKVMSCSLMLDICVHLDQSWSFDILHTQCSRPSEPSPPFSLTQTRLEVLTKIAASGLSFAVAFLSDIWNCKWWSSTYSIFRHSGLQVKHVSLVEETSSQINVTTGDNHDILPWGQSLERLHGRLKVLL